MSTEAKARPHQAPHRPGRRVVRRPHDAGRSGHQAVIRTVLVPALMHLSGNANWWLPRWLDRLIPHLNVEGAHHPAPAPARPLTAGATVPASRD